MNWDVTLVTYDRVPEGTEDDGLLADALRAMGARVRFCVWDDPAVDWAAAPITCLRSIWDYFHKPEAFRAWLGQVEGQTRLVNPARVIRWNMDKRYLADLQARGIGTVPTLFAGPHDRLDLAQACAARGWAEVVVKPTVSGGAFGTKRFARGELAFEGAAHLAALIERGGAMVQPYLPVVETERERSLVYLDGVFSHAIRKTPFASSYASASNHLPSADELAFAETVLACVGETLAYARVDIAPMAGGSGLMELEVIEPCLLFAAKAGSGRRLAEILLAQTAWPASAS